MNSRLSLVFNWQDFKQSKKIYKWIIHYNNNEKIFQMIKYEKKTYFNQLFNCKQSNYQKTHKLNT